MYELEFDREAVEFLSKLDKALRKRIFSKIYMSKSRPFHYFDKLKGRDDYRMRVGSYRVIADIDMGSKKIMVTLIGHRKNIYSKR